MNQYTQGTSVGVRNDELSRLGDKMCTLEVHK